MSAWNDLFMYNEAPSGLFSTENEFSIPENEPGTGDESQVTNTDMETDSELPEAESIENEKPVEGGDDISEDMDSDIGAESEPGEEPEGEFTPEEKERRLFIYDNMNKATDLCDKLLEKCFAASEVDTEEITKQTNKLKELLIFYKEYKFDLVEIDKSEKIIKDAVKLLEKLIKKYKSAKKAANKES